MVTVEIATSSHPEFDLFATAHIAGRQVAIRGDRVQVDAWIARLIEAAERHGYTVEIADTTAR